MTIMLVKDTAKKFVDQTFFWTNDSLGQIFFWTNKFFTTIFFVIMGNYKNNFDTAQKSRDFDTKATQSCLVLELTLQRANEK